MISNIFTSTSLATTSGVKCITCNYCHNDPLTLTESKRYSTRSITMFAVPTLWYVYIICTERSLYEVKLTHILLCPKHRRHCNNTITHRQTHHYGKITNPIINDRQRYYGNHKLKTDNLKSQQINSKISSKYYNYIVITSKERRFHFLPYVIRCAIVKSTGS